MNLVRPIQGHVRPQIYVFGEHCSTSFQALTNKKLQTTSVEPDCNQPSAKLFDVDATCKKAQPPFLIDLDFDKPIPGGRSRVHPSIPLAKSTNRRYSGHSRLLRRNRASQARMTYCSRNIETLILFPASITKTVADADSIRERQNFLSLPGEIRESVYNHVFHGARVYINQKPFSVHAFDFHPHIRLTCKQIYAETLRSYFRSLTINLLFESLDHDHNKVMQTAVPNHIFDNVESLSITASADYPAHNPKQAFILPDVPALRHLTYVNVRQCVPRGLEHFALFEIVLAGLANGVMTQQNQPHWLSNLPQRKDRKYLLTFEVEIAGQKVESRADHMGMLKREKHRTKILRFSERRIAGNDHSNDDTPEIESSSTEISSLTDLQSRKEMYVWMSEKQPSRQPHRYIPSNSYTHHITQLLMRLEYHDRMDKIEAGLTRTLKRLMDAEKIKDVATEDVDSATEQISDPDGITN